MCPSVLFGPVIGSLVYLLEMSKLWNCSEVSLRERLREVNGVAERKTRIRFEAFADPL